MTVQEFVKIYNELTSDKLQEGTLNSINIKTFLPIAQKRMLIDMVLSNIIIYDNGFVTYDSIDKHICFMTQVVSFYTDLMISDAESDYDSLVESGLLNVILPAIGKDYERLSELFYLRIEDTLRQNNIVTAMNNILISLQGGLQQSTQSMVEDLQTVDVDKMKTLFNLMNAQK